MPPDSPGARRDCSANTLQMCGQIFSKVKCWCPGDSGPVWKTASRPRRGLSRQPSSSSSPIPVVLPTPPCPLMQEAGRRWPLCELALQGEVYGEGGGRLFLLGISPPSYFSRGVTSWDCVFPLSTCVETGKGKKKKKPHGVLIPSGRRDPPRIWMGVHPGLRPLRGLLDLSPVLRAARCHRVGILGKARVWKRRTM